MAVEKEPGVAQCQEYLWMVALYEYEERTGELLERLSALGVDTTEATVVRVTLGEAVTAASLTAAAIRAPTSSISPLVRNAVTGAIIGSLIVLLLGLLLYSVNLVRFSVIEGVFAHALLSAFIGAILGAALGAILSALQREDKSAVPIKAASAQNREGFLVAVKMPPKLAERAEEIARRLGAKEILI